MTAVRALLVVDVLGYANADIEVRRFWAGRAVQEQTTALAVIVHLLVMRVVATFFKRFARPPFPFEIFGDVEHAVAWARGHKPQHGE